MCVNGSCSSVGVCMCACTCWLVHTLCSLCFRYKMVRNKNTWTLTGSWKTVFFMLVSWRPSSGPQVIYSTREGRSQHGLSNTEVNAGKLWRMTFTVHTRPSNLWHYFSEKMFHFGSAGKRLCRLNRESRQLIHRSVFFHIKLISFPLII